MKKNQRTGRLIGLLLLLIVVLGIPSVNLRGLSTSMAASPEFLNEVFQKSVQMRFAVLLDIITSALWLVVAVILFPVIRHYRKGLALGFFGIWVAYLAVILFSNISHLSLLSLSHEFVKTEATNLDFFNTLGLLKIEDYFWAHFIAIMLYASAAWIFYYFLFRTQLVPRFLSAWGLVAISLAFLACWLNIFDISVSFYFFLQNGLHMIVLLLWLLMKGFNTPKTTGRLA
ncbi:DUF4386 domain-containing protein [Ulvibacterium sp.]|uniref:DUF4386 domain-containing protein n=1 Tax=Ulvibacterium sp. TaxID=2665914 RepID=UPI00262E6CC6|nr:DUF4386 domain-containing protein [Ulvibacterium sp.]